MSSLYIYTIIFLCSFLVAFVAVKIIIRVALENQIGQRILEDGPVWHKKKEGTPTMGGIAFPVAIIFSFLVLMFFLNFGQSAKILPIFGVVIYALLNSIIGFIDDYIKIKNNQNKGLSASRKFALQSLAAIAFIIYLIRTEGISTIIKIPFVNLELNIGIFYYLFAYLLLCGFVNAVNLTDGLDGLASSAMLPVALLFSIVGLFIFEDLSFSFIGASVLGLLVAFLLFNHHPAKIFMGDTGSLFLGGILAGLSLCIDNVLLVFLFGFVYLFEATSVIIQVVYFKITRGKRIFKMAPFHHHLEKCGWSEKKIVITFVAVNSLACIVALLGMVV